MDFPGIHGSIQAAAVLIGFGRGLWRWYPAWSSYLILATVQSLSLSFGASDLNQHAGGWTVAAPFLLIGLVDSVLELFLRCSELYRRFRRDRWKWLIFPLVVGALAGLFLVRRQIGRPSDFYSTLFIAYAIVGSVCASILLAGWVASIPVRIPINLRKHLALLAIYVGTNTVAFANYSDLSNQQMIQNILNFMPPIVTLAWALILDPQEETQAEKSETEMPDSTLENLLGMLKRLS